MSETTLTHDPDSGCGMCPLAVRYGKALRCAGIGHEVSGWMLDAPPDCPLRGGRVVVQAGKGESDA